MSSSEEYFSDSSDYLSLDGQDFDDAAFLPSPFPVMPPTTPPVVPMLASPPVFPPPVQNPPVLPLVAPPPAPIRPVFAQDPPPPRSSVCNFCRSQHQSLSCPRLTSLSPSARHSVILASRRCFNCLGRHRQRLCRSPRGCLQCGERHHTIIHEYYHPAQETPSAQAPLPAQNTSPVIRQLVPISPYDLPRRSRSPQMRAAFDSRQPNQPCFCPECYPRGPQPGPSSY